MGEHGYWTNGTHCLRGVQLEGEVGHLRDEVARAHKRIADTDERVIAMEKSLLALNWKLIVLLLVLVRLTDPGTWQWISKLVGP